MNVLEKILGEIKARKEEWDKGVPTEYEKNVCQGIEIAEEIVEEHLKCSGWIPVTERLPEEEERYKGRKVIDVLVTTATGKVTKVQRQLTYKDIWTWGRIYGVPKAWMPLPTPYAPKEPTKQSALSEREKFFTEGAPIYERTQTE